MALEHNGIRTKFSERATEFRMVGSGITMRPNATRILERLGIASDRRDVGVMNEHRHAMAPRAVERSGSVTFITNRISEI
ncbi:hypothetical protein EA472_18220 [Natrarchaeobius oligotrophus]|uniref:Uncharacterized protein n=1 Tax=Natrarchaeobius chitinivorans TaxID=1679083 RepID=A0A3N6MC96_NATCH|nr:hypothetical protein EA472_18220 [Natrarchaeobius chitinivorans]